MFEIILAILAVLVTAYYTLFNPDGAAYMGG